MQAKQFKLWDKLSRTWVDNFYIKPDGKVIFTTPIDKDFSYTTELCQYVGRDKLNVAVFEHDLLKKDSSYVVAVLGITGIEQWERTGSVLENPELLNLLL